MAGRKGGDLIPVFFGKHRAGRIEHFATRREGLPQGLEDLRLLGGEARDVVGAAQPLDVGVAAHHAGGGAGHVGEDALEGAAVPPGVELAAVAGLHLGGEAEAGQVFADPLGPDGAAVEGGEGHVGRLEDVGALAAGRGAGVEHALAVVKIEIARSVLGAGVLHAEAAFGKPREAADGQRLVEEQGARGEAFYGDAGRGKVGQHFVVAGPQRIDPQGHRRVGVAGGEDGAPFLRVLILEATDPPGRVAVLGDHVGVGRLGELAGLAQGVAQHAVGDALELAADEVGGGADGLVDDRVGGVGAYGQAVQGDP